MLLFPLRTACIFTLMSSLGLKRVGNLIEQVNKYSSEIIVNSKAVEEKWLPVLTTFDGVLERESCMPRIG